MNYNEIALQITLKAIEHGMIFKGKGESVSEINEKTANEVGKFYNSIYNAIEHSGED